MSLYPQQLQCVVLEYCNGFNNRQDWMDKDLFDLLALALLSMGPKAGGFLSSNFKGLFYCFYTLLCSYSTSGCQHLILPLSQRINEKSQQELICAVLDPLMSLPHVLENIIFYGTGQFQGAKLEQVFACWQVWVPEFHLLPIVSNLLI